MCGQEQVIAHRKLECAKLSTVERNNIIENYPRSCFKGLRRDETLLHWCKHYELPPNPTKTYGQEPSSSPTTALSAGNMLLTWPDPARDFATVAHHKGNQDQPR